MTFPIKLPSIGGIASFAAIIGIVLVTGTLGSVKLTTDHLLYQDATLAARNWARLLGDTVTDMEQIADGQLPSSASMRFFDWARKAGQVFRYEIYNRDGYSQLVSEGGVAQVDIADFSREAVKSRVTNTPVVSVHENGADPGRPSFYARAFVPVTVGGNAVAIVGAYVDQSEKRDTYYSTYLVAAGGLCLLTALAFGIPAVAWIRRTREKQQADRRIRFLAHHDGLTELANRASLMEQLEVELAEVVEHGGSLAVHFIDIDRFKEVNDALGHDGGDFLLKSIAHRLRSAVRTDDIIARMGGDEFVVVQRAIDGPNDAEEFAARLIKALEEPLAFRENEIIATVSIGVAIAPRDGTSPERVLKSADLALYRSKADGRNCVRFFTADLDEELQARLTLEKTVRHAATHDGFRLHYQPVVDVSTHTIRGFEALMRLELPDGTNIPPLTFVPVLEDLHLIEKAGEWIIEEACRTAATWPAHLSVAVNLSPMQFGVGSIAKNVSSGLRKAGLAPHRLELEITETLLLGDTEAVMAELREIKAMGVAVVMDDFGTGYSSLSYLWRFPFDKIKIDQSFMRGFSGDEGHGREAAMVVKTIIALGRELGMQVTVEGVESTGQLSFLNEANADLVQGFLFGKAVPNTEVAAALTAELMRTMAERKAAAKQPPLPAPDEDAMPAKRKSAGS